MVTVCWSIKGGSGTSVVAAGLALSASRRDQPSVLIDLDGDALRITGNEPNSASGVWPWLRADPSVGYESLLRLSVPVNRTCSVIPAGRVASVHDRPDVPLDRWQQLLAGIRSEPRSVVVDLGSTPVRSGSGRELLLSSADCTLLIVRPCFLALRRAVELEVRPTGIVLVREDGRSLGRGDVEAALGAPVITEVPFLPSIARSVDSGLFGDRLPRPLERAVRSILTYSSPNRQLS